MASMGARFILLLGLSVGHWIGPGTGGNAAEVSSETHPAIAVQIPGIENTYRLGTNLLSGGKPEGAAAFAALAKLGIKTILSVDGARPDVELAKRHGLRYVHLPVGYDGIDRERQALLIQAAQTFPGTIFVHCHHGKHRGPAATAVMLLSTGDWNKEAAAAWLIQAGTSTNYTGLFKCVEQFMPPSPESLRHPPASFPEVAEVPQLAALMVQMDERWDRLRAIRSADAAPPRLREEAALLHELARESRRLAPPGPADGELSQAMQVFERETQALLQWLATAPAQTTPARLEETDRHLARLGQSCTACHRKHRDQ